jgi:hypothetical protein
MPLSPIPHHSDNHKGRHRIVFSLAYHVHPLLLKNRNRWMYRVDEMPGSMGFTPTLMIRAHQKWLLNH